MMTYVKKAIDIISEQICVHPHFLFILWYWYDDAFQEVEQDPQIGRIISENKPEWVCWQTGLQLQYLDTTLFSVK